MRAPLEQVTPQHPVAKPRLVGPTDNPYLHAPGKATTKQRLSPSAVLALQQTRGNSAVCRMLAAQRQAVVQREPDDDDDALQAQQPLTFGPASADQADAAQPDGSAPPEGESAAPLPGTDSNTSVQSATAASASSETNQSSSTDTTSTTDTTNSTDGGTLIGDPVEGEATPVEVEANAGCDDLDLQGLTQASYGGSFTTSSISYTNVGDDVQATGTITCTFTVGTTVTLPSTPSGLSDCETAKVNNAIRTILAPHEQQHVAAFRTFAGRTVRQFNLTLPGMNTSAGAATLNAAVQPLLQGLYDGEQATRQGVSDAASAALDPFHFTIDCSDCNPPSQ